MGERVVPAASSNEPPRTQSPTDVPGNGTPPVPANLSDPASDPEPATGATKGTAEVAFAMEQAYYEQILENAPEAISIIDLDLNISRINGEFTRLFGFTAAEAVGKRLDVLIVPPDRYAETAWITESMKTQNKLSLETRRRRKDESLVEVLLSTSPVTVNGEKVGFYACYRDITEQKRAEELNAALYAIAARSQAEDLQQFFAAIHNIVGQLMNARNFYIALYDPPSQLLSFPYFVDEEDSTPEPKRLGRGLTEYVLHSGEPLLATPTVFEELVKRGEVDLIGAPSLDWLGVPLKGGANSIGVLVVQSYNESTRYGERDREILKFVSQQLAAAIEHKRYEEALRRSEARSRSLILSAAFGICRCTVGGKFLDVNPALIGMLGRGSVEELLGLDVRHEVFVNSHELDRLAEDCRRAGTLNGVEVQWKRKDGRVIIVRLSGCAAPDSEDPEEVLELMAEDITDRRQLEEQLRQAQKMDAVGRLAGGVAHDFNNLLMVINGYTEVLLEELDSDGPMYHKVESIKQAADRAATLTRQLLAFSRKQLLELKVIDVNSVIADMERLLRPLIGENIELMTRLSSDTGHTRADAGQLEQVIMNLVVNAKDAMPEGGKLTVQSSEVTVRLNLSQHRFIQPGRYAVISVSDTGHGMDKETRSRIFEPFFTTKEKGKGTGLGLSTVYGIVKQSNGYVFAQSEPGAGATFYVYLPRVEDSAEELSPAKTPYNETDGSETVLLVEDEESVRELVRITLGSRGYKVLEAEDGEAGLRVADSFKERIDILITDVVMPGIGGRELAKRLLALRPGLSVLYLSGYTEDAVITQGAPSPATAFLQKPFTLQNLARKVREILRAKSSVKSIAKSASN
jgi:two-component system, cell cycle sensor histidine kinase and response regulator CckA